MDEATRAAMMRVLETIPDPGGRALVSDVLRLSLVALQDFAALDEAIYSHFLKDGAKPLVTDNELDAIFTEVVLDEVHSTTFRGIRRLITFLSSRNLLGEQAGPASTARFEVDLNDGFDLDLVPVSKASRPPGGLLSLDDFDIDQALDGLAPETAELPADKMAQFREEIAMLGFALQRQLQGFEERITSAIRSNKFELALRELDFSRDSLVEGLFAIVTGAFRLFVGDIERTALLPGYKTALQQALMLRRGLADLGRTVKAENEWVIQDASLPDETRVESIQALVIALREFMGGEVFHVMRATDRLELANFFEKLSQGSFSQAVLATEGMAKYLESLSVVSQREVLVEHDQSTITNIKQSLEAARSLLQISFEGAQSLVREALGQAQHLYGRNPVHDEQLDVWEQEDDQLLTSPESVERVVEQLEQMVGR